MNEKILKNMLLNANKNMKNEDNQLQIPFSSTPKSSSSAVSSKRSDTSNNDKEKKNIKPKTFEFAKSDGKRFNEKFTISSLSSLAYSSEYIMEPVKIKINNHSIINDEKSVVDDKVEKKETSFDVDNEKLENFKNGLGKIFMNEFFVKNSESGDYNLNTDFLNNKENKIEKLVADKFFEQIDNFFHSASKNEDQNIINETKSLIEKKNFFKNFHFKNKTIKKVVNDYLKFSQLLIDNKYLSTIINENCSCFYNLFDCCINKIYKEFQDQDNEEDDEDDNNAIFSFNLLENCCNCCDDENKESNYSFKFSFLKNKNLTVNQISLKISSISLLRQFKLNFLNSKLNSNCLKNSLKCCINYLHVFFMNNESDEEQLDEAFINYKCCVNVKKTNENFLNELLGVEEKEQSLSFILVEDDNKNDDVKKYDDEKTISCKESFIDSFLGIENNDKKGEEIVQEASNEDKTKHEEKVVAIENCIEIHVSQEEDITKDLQNSIRVNQTDDNIQEKITQSIEISKFTDNQTNSNNDDSRFSSVPPNIQSSESLPASVKTKTIKKSTLKTSSNNSNKVRKSVHFLEDSKYGLVYVEIPEWQETFREPVYTNRSSKDSINKPEWKLDPVKNSYDSVKNILKKN